VILSVLWWIPVAGPIILFVVSLVGVGATCASLWGRSRRKEPGQTAPPVVPGAPLPPGPPPA